MSETLTNIFRSRRAWIAIATVAALAVWAAIADARGRNSYRGALAAFGVKPSNYEMEETAVRVAVLARAPIGAPDSRIVTVLDSLGFRPSTDYFARRPAFYIDSTKGSRSVNAHWPYQDPPFSFERFVCDRPALRLSFTLDDSWKLVALDVTTARACV